MAQNDWILDVLADLKNFAAANGMVALAEQLDDTKIVAAAELSSTSTEVNARTDGDQFEPGSNHQGFGRHQSA
jgi:hypothetical protein